MNFLLSRKICGSGLLKNAARLFSTSKIEIQMHEAILASRIIKQIESDVFHMEKSKIFSFKPSQNSDGLKSPFTGLNTSFSLRANLISMIKSYSEGSKQIQQGSFDKIDHEDSKKTAAKNMMSLFEGGVLVQTDMCSQQRFLDEKQQTDVKSAQKLGKQAEKLNIKKPQKHKKLSFCPTYLVTGQIFRKILLGSDFLMITGHFGTGKTHSFMLYHLLTEKIYKYLHSCTKQQIQPFPQITLYPKLIYWTINLNQLKSKQGKQIINEIIKRQCFEIADQIPNYKFTQIIQGEIDLGDFYLQKGITLRLVIDQIQTFSNEKRFQLKYLQKKQSLNQKYINLKRKVQQNPQLMKQVNTLKQKHQLQLAQQFGQSSEVHQRIMNMWKLNDIVKKLRIKFGKVFYLTSKNIEQYVLKKLDLTGQGSHGPLWAQSLKYKQYYQSSENNHDLAELIAFMLEIKIKTQGELTQTQKNILQETKKIIFQQLENKYYFLMPLSISYLIFGKGPNVSGVSQTIQKIINQNNLSQLSLNVKQLLVQIDQRSNSELIQLVNNFTQMNNKNQQDSREVRMTKKILMLKLLHAAKSIQLANKLNPEASKNPIQIDIQRIFSNKDNIARNEILQQMDKNLFTYTNDKKFQLEIHEDSISKLLNELQIPLLKALLEQDAKISSLIQTTVSKGRYIESLIRRCLSVPQTTFTFWFQYKNSPKSVIRESMMFSKINKTDNKLFFTPIPLKTDPKYRQFSFLNSFESQILLNQIGSYFFLPQKQRFKNLNQEKIKLKAKEVDQTSIDFVLVLKQSSKVIINGFDITISLQSAINKISDFFIQFSNFADKHKSKIQIQNKHFDVEFNYVILTPKLLKNNILWINKLNKSISHLEQQLKQLKERQGSQKNQAQTQKRIVFLKGLLENSEKHKSVFEVKKKCNFKTMLSKVAIVSFFDAKLENIDKEKISFELRLLQQAKRDYFENPQQYEQEPEQEDN